MLPGIVSERTTETQCELTYAMNRSSMEWLCVSPFTDDSSLTFLRDYCNDKHKNMISTAKFRCAFYSDV